MIVQKDIDIFWKKIIFPENLDDCWVWNGNFHKTTNNGVFRTKSNHQFSSKTFSYIIHNNFIEVSGRNIIQICDNMNCVNPSHLQLHGMSGTREHKFYEDMVSRVLRKGHKYYKDYGGRGIDIDPRYNPDLHSLKGVAFLNLYNDMIDLKIFPIPDGYSIDRIDNDKGYWKENLRLSTSQEQSQNTRRTKFTKEQILEIRRLHSLKLMSNVDMAKKYNCHENYIVNIAKRKNWNNI